MPKMFLNVVPLFVLASIILSCSSNSNNTIDVVDNLPNISGYPIVDTGTTEYYSNDAQISEPVIGASFYGQDSNYLRNQPSYTNNNDGTITDNVTGLMWEQDMDSKITFEEAFVKAQNSTLGGYTD